MHSGPLRLDESSTNSDDEVDSQPSDEDDQMNVDNPIHDRPPLVGRLDVLVVISPTPSNKNI